MVAKEASKPVKMYEGLEFSSNQQRLGQRTSLI